MVLIVGLSLINYSSRSIKYIAKEQTLRMTYDKDSIIKSVKKRVLLYINGGAAIIFIRRIIIFIFLLHVLKFSHRFNN